MKFRTASLIACLVALFHPAGAEEEFLLFDSGSGIGPAPVYLMPGAPPFTRAAAVEFLDYVEKVSGQRPEFHEDAPVLVPERAVWIGFQPTVATLFPDLDPAFSHPEEILLAAGGGHLLIAGRDRWDPENLVVQGIDEAIEGRQQEYGTVNAVYTFLQDHLGVRWLWPGELGEDVPQKKRLAFAPFSFRYHPQILARGGIFNYSQLSNRGYGRAQMWTRRQRLQLCSLEIGGGHGFGDWWERFHETHPDIFALQPDGTRSGHPSPHNAKLCQSNPQIAELWLKDVAAQLAADPNETVFNASPNDGWSSGHCVCDSCRARDHPDGEPRLMHWHHFREERPALSDRHVTFANHLAAALRKRYPDREDYRVMMLSYGHSRPGPVVARPEENVIMVSVANFLGRTGLVDRGSTLGVTYREQFGEWGKVAPALMWRPNTGSPAGWQQGLPDLSLRQTMEDFQFVADNHCIGIFIDAIWEHWATLGPQYYLMGQLGWNPREDGEAILTDYYDRGFGAAAEEIRGYFDLFETARMRFVAAKNYETSVLEFPELYTAGLLAEAGACLDRAAAAVPAGVYRDRIAFVRAGYDYTRHLVAVIERMSGYWAAPDEAVAEEVRRLWVEIEAIANDPPYAINPGPVRPGTPRMLGLHPDHPNPKWKRRPPPGAVNDLDQN